MGRTWRILKPLLGAALILSGARLALDLADGPEFAGYLFSLTGLQMLAMGYLPWRIAREQRLGLHHVWLALTALFAFSQLLYAGSLLGSHLLGDLNPRFWGIEREADSEQLWTHLFLHFKIWVVALPVAVTALVGTPLVYFLRRPGRWGESGADS